MTRPALINSVLNDIEKAELQAFADNTTMREAVKKVLLLDVYFMGTMEKGKPVDPLTNYTLSMASKKGQYSNEALGADLRATWEGINTLQTAFEELEKFKSAPKTKGVDNSNPGK